LGKPSLYTTRQTIPRPALLGERLAILLFGKARDSLAS
jgi:hypothetical protein